MGKRSQKLLVYLDQNFLSNMSKADVNERVRPEFREIYELLHQGFVDEKLVAPSSWLHDVESSLATHLRDRIVAYQHYLGQVRLRRPDEIRNTQTFATLDLFMSRTSEDPLRPKAALLDDPDQRVRRFDVTVNAHLQGHNFRLSRNRTADDLEQLREHLLQDAVSYDKQIGVEQCTQRAQFIQAYSGFCGEVSEKERKKIESFANSLDFANIPLLRVEAHLFASILTRYPRRQIKASDVTDIEALSAYAPYMDVVCTDAFMTEQLREVAKEYEIKLFNAKISSLQELKVFLERHLSSVLPIRRPSITVFVLPPKQGRQESFQFFYRLGSALQAMGMNEYGEIYAFDDGAMPKYELSQLPGHGVPFFGLQDVTTIDVSVDANEAQLLDVCRAHCRSDYFVFIDKYRDIKSTFMLGAAMCAEHGLDSTQGYRIYKRQS